MEIVHFLPEDIAYAHSNLQNIIAVNRNHHWDDEEDYDLNITDATGINA